MSTCPADLWRAAHSSDFPNGPIIDGEPAEGILYPTFEHKLIGTLPNGKPKYRKPDIKISDDDGKVRPGAGTSLFDKEKVFRGKAWRSFHIPKDTLVDPNLSITGPDYNEVFDANHYQIEPAKPMFPDVYKGALDNFARAALAKAYELARS
ncbi:MAG TPA: hypothetical protein VMA74_07590 [Dyella sp.]|uniref:Tse2 family ADP-ribosyltransferase toxin n=1 Tax=Dyella sp. TaxID=1869338 RepID=UPI002C1D2227|nr:hypothetical protein [Dyella sp.]HUB89578.1 hypothetical protein [Dyella sp.]